MNLQDLANTDLKVIAGWARAGLEWWLDELAGMAPWGLRGPQRRRLVAHLAPDGAGYGLWDGGEELEPWVPRPGARHKAALALPPGQVLVRELEVPILPLRDVRRMAALEIERLTPFRAEAIHFDLEVAGHDAETGKQRIRLGVVGREAAAAALARAHDLGLEPEAIGVSPAGEPGALRFDFLPALRALQPGSAAAGRTAWWWCAAGGLLAANIALLVVRDALDVGALRQAVEAQTGTAAVAMRLKQSVDREGQRRRVLADRKLNGSPLRALDAATKALPVTAWAQRFEWNGASMRLVGYRPGALDVPGALERAPLFAQVRAATAEGEGPTPAAANTPATLIPFDVTAAIRPRPGS